MKVKFLEDCVVHDHNGEVEVEYKEGKTEDLSDASADRWIRRGKAEVPKAKAKAE